MYIDKLNLYRKKVSSRLCRIYICNKHSLKKKIIHKNKKLLKFIKNIIIREIEYVTIILSKINLIMINIIIKTQNSDKFF